MARPRTDLHKVVREILEHTLPLPPEASSPIKPFDRTASAVLSTLRYFIDSPSDNFCPGVMEKHASNFRRMALVSLVEALERFLKELAALCIDSLVPHVHDDRFDDFSAKGGQIVFHLSAGSVGKALCESDTWLTNKSINERFKRLLKLPFGDNWRSNLFPEENQSPPSERERARTLAILWQMRHTISHNVGVITGSDAGKFKMLVKRGVESNRILSPATRDIIYVKRFLVETAESVNLRVGGRLAEVLTALHSENPALFDPAEKANSLPKELGFAVTINGTVGAL